MVATDATTINGNINNNLIHIRYERTYRNSVRTESPEESVQ